MLLGWWLESFVSAVQKPTQLQILRRVPDGAHQARQHIIGEVVVLLQSGVNELKKSHQDALRPPLRWRPLSYPGQARDVASWPWAAEISCCSESAAIWGIAGALPTHSGRQPVTQGRHQTIALC